MTMELNLTEDQKKKLVGLALEEMRKEEEDAVPSWMAKTYVALVLGGPLLLFVMFLLYHAMER